MAQTAADVVIDTLHDRGVDVIFGLPGDGINFIQVRHEESAAFVRELI